MNDIYGYDPEMLGLKRGKYRGKDEIHVFCPFHGGHGTSATFNVRTGEFWCFSCQRASNVYELAAQFGGIVTKGYFPPAEKEEDNWRENLKARINVKNDYLLGRGVTPQQIEEYEIREFDNGVGIPLKDHNGVDRGMVIRNYRGPHRYNYCGERLLGWPLQNMPGYDRKEPLIVVEGIFGALRGLKYGYNTFATLGVMMKNEVKTKWLSQFKRVIVVYDNDQGGRNGYLRILKGVQRVEVVLPGYETDEANEKLWDFIVNKSTKVNDRSIIEKLLRG